jgi:hypothetical protein
MKQKNGFGFFEVSILKASRRAWIVRADRNRKS